MVDQSRRHSPLPHHRLPCRSRDYRAQCDQYDVVDLALLSSFLQMVFKPNGHNADQHDRYHREDCQCEAFIELPIKRQDCVTAMN